MLLETSTNIVSKEYCDMLCTSFEVLFCPFFCKGFSMQYILFVNSALCLTSNVSYNITARKPYIKVGLSTLNNIIKEMKYKYKYTINTLMVYE